MQHQIDRQPITNDGTVARVCSMSIRILYHLCCVERITFAFIWPLNVPFPVCNGGGCDIPTQEEGACACPEPKLLTLLYHQRRVLHRYSLHHLPFPSTKSTLDLLPAIVIEQ